jgi:hypothetical protein
VSLHRYLGRYPQGRHAQKAMQDVVQIAGVEVALGKNYGAQDMAAIHAAVPVLRGYLANYPTGHLADEVRGKLAVIEAGAAVASEVEIERPDAHVSETIAVRAHQVPSSARIAELEGGGDAPAWSDAPRAATNEAASAYLPRRRRGVPTKAGEPLPCPGYQDRQTRCATGAFDSIGCKFWKPVALCRRAICGGGVR